MFESLVIIGYGGHAAEAASVALAVSDVGGMKLAGFIDSEPSGKPGTMLNFPLLGDESFLDGRESEFKLHIAIGDNEIRRKVAEKFPAFSFACLIHPSAIAGPDVVTGDGSLVTPGSILTARLTIGNHVIINTGSIVSHDCEIGDYANISPGCVIAGNVSIGEGAFLGCSVNCVPGVRIGAGAMVAIGSVVTKDIPPGVVAAGIPARAVKDRD